MHGTRRLLRLATALAFAAGVPAAHASTDHALADCVVMPQPARSGAPAKAVLTSTDIGNVTVMQIDGNYDRGQTAPRQNVATAFLSQHPDAYDFLIAFTTFEFETGDATAFYNAIRNDVAGIGSDTFDYSAAFGSAGRLQGYIDMAATSRYELKPRDARYEASLDVLAHELMHRWGARLRYRDAGGADSGALIGREGAHWSFFLDSDASTMYGNDWRRRDDGSFESVAVRRRYSDLDLYAAGFAAPGEVAPVTLIRNGDGDANAYPLLGAVTGGQPETVTIEQIVAANGARVPAAADSPKEFRAALILLTRPGEQVTPQLLYSLESLRTRFQQRFAQMTDGRARLRIFTERDNATVPALPEILAGSGDAATAPGNAAAVAWIEARQAADGHWQDRAATAMRDTVAALRALEALAPASPAIARARAWIAQRTVASNDEAAWRYLATRDAAHRDALAAAAAPDDGWGLADGYAASPFDTALVADLVATHAPGSTAVDAALGALVPAQNADGSYGATAGGRGRLLPTLHAARVLGASGDAAHRAAASRAGTWLDGRRIGNGYGQGANASLADTIELFSLVGKIPLDASGVAGARAFVRARQQVDGDWGGSVYLTATAALASANDARVNLAVPDAIVAAPAAPSDGERVTLAASVVNAGNAAAPATVARWYDGDPDAGGVQIGADVAVPAVLPGSRQSIATMWDTTGRAGAHAIHLVVDADQAVPELREDDNRATLALTVGEAPLAADLQLTAAALSLDPGTVAQLPANVRLTGVVRNLGRTAATGVRVTLHAASAPAAVLAEATLDVPPRGSAPLDLAFTIAQANALALVVRADPDGVIAEAREDNNEARLTLGFGESVDLEVGAGDLALVGAAVAGRDATLRVDVHNRGTLATPPAVLRAQIVQNGTTYTVFDAPIELAAGATARRQLAWRAPAAGAAQLRVVLDPAGQVAEAREDNNAAQLDFTVAAADSPDLAAVVESLEFTPTPALQGRSVTASLRVRNFGPDVTTPFAVGVYAGDPRLGAARIGSTTVAGLAGSAETTVAVVVPDLDVYGTPTLYALVDADAAVAEIDEANNVAIKPLEVLSLPDAAVSLAGIVLTPALPVAGEPVVARVTVRNLGQQDARDVAVRFAEGDGAAAPIGTETIAVLPAGGSVELQWHWTFGANVRAVSVEADPADTVRELTNDNNRATLPVDVQNGNLFTSERYISPNGDGVRDATAVVFRLPAGGDATVRVVNGSGYELRRYDGVATSGDGRGQVIWDGRDAYGRIAADGDYRIVVATAGGPAHGELVVTVDNNRSSVIEAIGTPYAIGTTFGDNASLQASSGRIPPAASAFAGWLYGLHVDVLPGPGGNRSYTGVYRAHTLRLPRIEAVVPSQWVAQSGASFIEGQRVAYSPSGRELAFDAYFSAQNASRPYRAAADGSGEIVPLLAAGAQGQIVGWFDDVEILLYDPSSRTYVVADALTGAARPFRAMPDMPLGYQNVRTTPSGVLVTTYGLVRRFVPRDPARPIIEMSDADAPEGSETRTQVDAQSTRLVVRRRTATRESVELVNLDTGARRMLVDRDNGYRLMPDIFGNRAIGTRELTAAWLDARREVVVVDGRERRLLRFNADGAALGDVALPRVERAGGYEGGDANEIVATFASVALLGVTCGNGSYDESPRGAYDPTTASLFVELDEIGVYPAVPSLTGAKAAPGLAAYEPYPLLGVAQYVRVDLDAGTVETLREGSGLGLELPADSARYPRFDGGASACGERYPDGWPVLVLGDGARLTVQGGAASPSRGAFELPRNGAVVGPGDELWPDESRALRYDKVTTSLLNGVAFVESRSVADAFELTGVAADRNFAYYELDYALASQPGVWNALTPASRDEVRLDEFLTWAPPQAGAYVVRLRVVDRAGNATTATTAVNARRGADIDGFGVSSRHISPDGDGVKDRAEVGFRVRQPASLAFVVERGDGSVVYRTEHSYGAGDLGRHTLSWDGRDDGGAPQPDGRYRIRFGGFAVWVVVDTVAPTLDARLLDAYRDDRGGLPREPLLTYAAADASGVLVSIDAIAAADGVATPFVVDAVVPSAELPVPLATYAASAFSVVATDPAGNATTRALAQAPQRLVLRGVESRGRDYPAPYQTPPLTDDAPTVDMAPARLDEDERDAWLYAVPAMASLRSVALQAAPRDAPAAWFEVARTPFAGAGAPQFEMPMTTQGLARGAVYRVRLVGERADGTTLASNHIQVQSGGVGPPECPFPGLPIATVVDYTAGTLRSATLAFKLRGEPGVGGTAAATRIEEDGATFHFSPPRAGTYDLVVDAVDEDGYAHRSIGTSCPLQDPPPEPAGYAFALRVLPVVADRCDGVPSGRLRATWRLDRGALPAPQQLRWRYVDGATLQERTSTPVDFVPGATPPPFDVDVRGWPDGTYRIALEGSSVRDGTTAWTEIGSQALPVETVPPDVSIALPQDGARVCAAQLPESIEGSVYSASRVGWRVSIGAGAAPTSWRCLADEGLEFDGGNCAGLDALAKIAGSSAIGRPLWRRDASSSLDGLALYDGAASIEVKALNGSGGTVCAARTIVLDSGVELVERAPPRRTWPIGGVEHVIVAPDGGAGFARAEISLDARETLDVVARVVDASGAAVATLLDAAGTSGDVDIVWDGRAGGAPVADGAYTIRIDAKDACGQTRSLVYPAWVKRAPPQLAFASPQAGATLAQAVVNVRGTIVDALLANWTLEAALAASPDNWQTIAHGTWPMSARDGVAPTLGSWSRGQATGPVELRLRADDVFGNRAAIVLPVVLGDPAALIAAAAANPALFSPNGDGVLDATRVEVALRRAADLSVHVRNSTGQPVATLFQGAATGTQSATWNGGAPDGDYTIVVDATDPQGVAAPEQALLPVALDSAAPALALVDPAAGFVRPEQHLSFSATDAHLVAFEATLARGGAVLATAQGTSSGTHGLVVPAGTAEGALTLRLSARDGAGNRAERTFDLVLDATAPLASFATPADAAVIAASSATAVAGKVADAHLASYTLSFAPAGSDAWTTIATGVADVDGAIAAWTPGVADGDYRLRLAATDRAGNAAEAIRHVTVDGTAPVARIDAPADDAIVKPALTVAGAATDAHFAKYTLALIRAAAYPGGVWTEVYTGTAPVDGATLAELVLPTLSGDYVLRLTVTDRAGLATTDEARVRVDDLPPPAPTQLVGSVENNRNVVLAWNAVAADDLAGYHVYRGGVRITAAPLAAPRHVDVDAPEGRPSYRVVAIDTAGNESAPSNTVTLALDRTAPHVALTRPAAGERVRGTIDVAGTAYSADDFDAYRVTLEAVNPPGAARELARATLPVQHGTLAAWNTLDTADEARVRLVVEAADRSGNAASASVEVIVDNLAPAAPDGVVAALATAGGAPCAALGGTFRDVRVCWNANVEPDLLGYLVYRDGRLVNAPNPPPGDLRPYAVREPRWLDATVPDGAHAYVVHAIDLAGNISAPSTPATPDPVDFDAPDLELVRPVPGERFESSLEIFATTDHRDVARVTFAYRAVGASGWTDIGVPLTVEPYRAHWTPGALPYGDYDVRAIAVDEAGRADPTPPVVRVAYADLTAPDAPAALAARADGGTVALTWTASAAGDVAGYVIYGFDNGQWREIAGPVAATAYADADRDDGDYRYRVVAVDASDNRSAPSNEATAHVFGLALDAVATPTAQASVAIAGRSARSGTLAARVENAAGHFDLPPVAVGADGRFALAAVALELGANDATLQLTDADGNRSRRTDLRVERGTVPAVPTGLAAAVADHRVDLTWNANAEPDLAGYRVFRRGNPVEADRPVAGIAASSASGYDPAAAVDGDASTAWEFSMSHDQPDGEDNPSIALELPAVVLVGAARLDWRGAVPPNVDLQARVGSRWITIASVRGGGEREQSLVPASAYRADTLRVVVRGTGEPAWNAYALGEIAVLERPLIAPASLSETLPDGRYDYRVSAVTRYGFESARSAPAVADIGDIEAPDPVVLTGTLAGADATLAWTASASADVARYVLARDGEPLATLAANAPRTFVDTALPNGTYAYAVTALDAYDNASEPSNTVVLTVAGPAPGVPRALAVTASAEGGALDLVWQPGDGAPATSFRVRRALASGGPFVEIASTDATAYRDEPLTDGVRYWYTVEAIDALGNASGASAPASGVPRVGAALRVPLVTAPTVAGSPLVTQALELPVCGYADAGTIVDVARDGIVVASVPVDFGDAETETSEYLDEDVLTFAPDGRHYAYLRGDGTVGVGARAGDLGPVTDTGKLATWASRGLALYYADVATGAIERVEPGRAPRALGIEIDGVRAFAIAPDETRIAFAGGYRGAGGTLATGVWIAGVDGADARRVDGIDAIDVAANGLAWSADGVRLLVRTPASLALVDARTARTLRTIAETADIAPAWSNDGRYAYATRDAGAFVVHIADAAGTTRQFARIDALVALAWSPDGTRIALQDGYEVDVRAASDGAPASRFWASERPVAWLASGHIAYSRQGRQNWRMPEGGFCTEPLALVAQRHEFVATARDGTGRTSLPSAPIVVTRAAATLPDWAIGTTDVYFVPADAVPGDRVAALVNVRNAGLAAAPANEVRAELTLPNGARRQWNAPLPALAAGASRAVDIDFGTLADAGTYRLRVTIDADARVAEADENNNRAEASTTLVAPGAPLVEIVPDRTLFAPGEPVTGTVGVANLAVAARVRLAAIDAAGAVVDELGEYPVGPLAPGERWTRPVTWPADGVLAGDYRLRARLVGANGAALGERHGAVAIAAVQRVMMAVEPEVAFVTAGGALRVRSAVAYTDGNAPIAGARLALVAVAPNGAESVVAEQTLGTLLPGYELRKEDMWNTAGLASGAYGLRLRLTAPNLDRSAETSVTVDDPVARVVLAGTLALAPADSLVAGVGGELAWTLANRGDAMLAGVAARVRVTAAGSPDAVAHAERTLDLAPGANDAGLLVLTAPPLALVPHLAVLEARLPGDAAGQWRTLARRSFGVVDGVAPQITLATPAGETLQPAAVPLRVGVVDAHSTVALVQVRVDGGAWQPLVRGEDGWYARGLAGLVDGAHRLAVRARDSWGNEASSAERAFVVDATAPTIAIAGVADGDLAATPVVPTIAVADANLASSDVRLNGEIFVSGTTIDADGEYALAVRATDRAGNLAQRFVRFRIDRTAPAVAIAAPVDGATVATSAIDVVVASEAAARVVLEVGAWQAQATAGSDGRATFAAVPLALGDNTLVAQAHDAAGNVGGPATARVRYDASGEGLAGSVQPSLAQLPHGQPLAVTLTAENRGAQALPAQRLRVRIAAGAAVLDEAGVTHDFAPGATHAQTFEFASATWALGQVAVTLEHERAGTWTELDRATVEVVDRDAPLLTALAPAAGSVLRSPAAVRAHATDALGAVTVVEARVDDGAWFALEADAAAPGDYAGSTPGLADGDYALALRAADTAGNVANAGPIAFAIDNTAPAIAIAGVADGDLAAHALTPTVTIADAHPATQSITLNGAGYVSGTPIAASGSYTLAAEATDLAGNRSETSVAFAIDLDAPVLAISSPLDGAVVDTPTIAVTGATEALAKVELDAGAFATQVFADANGAFAVIGATLAPGANTIRARATDRAGNVGSYTVVRVTYEPTAATTLTGTLAPLPPQVPRGGPPLALDWTVRNPSASAVADVPVRVALRLAGADVATHAFTVSLAAQATQAGAHAFETRGFDAGRYDVVLEARQPVGGGEPQWIALAQRAVDVYRPCVAPRTWADRLFLDGFDAPDLIWCDGFDTYPDEAKRDARSAAPWLAFDRAYAVAAAGAMR
ncbi:CARDB domain-containing protein [Tahibacter soli]|uniref:CARDB domain-containing protein n=1 Tax=Tahibacter soli TaxID=2983605 RepID=A0A9X4BK03_9GAMM|nr:CARDB domain-containing protein [Tahibacter soli]MDC8013722.1 CARDB domain-containing protein [Tahibacter soli]